MTQLQFQFKDIKNQALRLGIPDRPRGILREYIQTQFIAALYRQRLAHKLSFIGGTALRLLRGIPRFSEDLDFDNLGLSNDEVGTLFAEAVNAIQRSLGVAITLSNRSVGEKHYFEFKIPDVLHTLGITTNDKEKLMIKLDYSTSWHDQKTESELFSHLGVFEQVVTNPLGQVMVQKLRAYVERKQTQPRDIYDVMWLHSRGVKPDMIFAKANECGDVVVHAMRKWQQEGASVMMQKRLEPFLFDSDESKKIMMFGAVLSI